MRLAFAKMKILNGFLKDKGRTHNGNGNSRTLSLKYNGHTKDATIIYKLQSN